MDKYETPNMDIIHFGKRVRTDIVIDSVTDNQGGSTGEGEGSSPWPTSGTGF